MEPVTSWSTETVTEWLRGLDVPLQQYPISEWQLLGSDLLQLSPARLDKLGVIKIGHQELILEAVEKLCALTYSVGGESLRSVTEKLRAVAHSLQMGIQGLWRINAADSHSAINLQPHILHAVVEVITGTRGLLSLLNRYQFAEQAGYTGSDKLVTLCKDLDATVHKDNTVYEKEKDIISKCRLLVEECDEILTVSPVSLLAYTPQLESVDLDSTSPGHHVSSEEFCEKALDEDEVVQVNGQIVVGWSRPNLIKKLEENPTGITLVLKRVPTFLKRKESQAKSERVEEEQEEEEVEEQEEEEQEKSRHSLLGLVAASVRSLSFRSGPDTLHQFRRDKSTQLADQTSSGPQISTLKHLHLGTDPQRSSRKSLEVRLTVNRSPSPRSREANRASVSSLPDMAGLKEEKENKKSFTKGTRTAMSRRRVSCRELSRPECDGWLWKKRKEVFMTQKWQKFWFILKGPTLYWYTSQQEEKAEGLLKIGRYSIEGAGEHKRKYVFKMCHPRFQDFIFAADNVTEMSKWINCLMTAIQKHKKLLQSQPDNEEDCYSETESEEESSRSPLPLRKVIASKTQPQSSTLPRTKPKQNRNSESLTMSKAEGAKVAGTVDEMDKMFHSLKKGGVTLIGQNQPVTHDQLRRSFIKRNKNPAINEKIHTLRALQSTLKAKEAELQLINKILEDSEFSPQKFREWKQLNEELLLDIESQQGQTSSPGADSRTGDDASGLGFSDGEQLVDADASDKRDSTLTDTASPVTDKNTGVENYFYI